MGGPTSRIVLAVATVFALSACDSRAKASDPQGRADSKSKEYESCGASIDCLEGLRCFEQVCRRTARSTVGDFFAALGNKLRAKGELNAAIDAYNRALGHYDTEKIALPPDIDCAYGSTLAAARGAKKETAELAARVLHRCVLAVPAGSALRKRALADLALVHEAGLDPLALGRTQLADVYLTRAPQKPSTDKLQVTVTPLPAVSKRTFPLIPARIMQPDLRGPLVACWEAYNKATRKTSMAVSIGLTSKYHPSDYDDVPGKYVMKIEPAVAMPAGPDANADRCVRAVVEPVLESISGVRDSFSTRLTITVK